MFYSRSLLAILLSLPVGALAQQTTVPEYDTQEIAKETEQLDSHGGKMGLFWWVPVEFWEQSAMKSGVSAARAKQLFAPLGNYNLFIVGVGHYSLNGISWDTEPDLRKNITLRDQAGNTYKPLEKPGDDAQGFSDMMKPILKNILGPMGEGVQLFFFPKKDPEGKEFADPRRTAELTLLVQDLMDPGVNTYVWRLPLTSLSPAKYCPVGKERVNANWKYCPWHGNKLVNEPATVSAPGPAKP